MDYEFDELRREFLAEARSKADEIAKQLDGSTTPPEAIERMAYLAHQLKGAGGSYGYQDISVEAAAIEKALEEVDGNEPGRIDSVRQHVHALSTAIEKNEKQLLPLPASGT